MTGEVVAALIGGVATLSASAVVVIPAAWASARRTRGAVEADGSATRDALTALSTQISDVKDEVRTDVFELRAHVIDVRAWQAGHDAEHYLQGRPQRGDTT